MKPTKPTVETIPAGPVIVTEHLTITDQIRMVAGHLKIKADTARRVSLDCPADSWQQRNWNGLADELNDSAWTLNELADGRDVEALIQGAKNRKRMEAERAAKKV